ncbi:MAG: DUF4160 domain-containing protein [Chlorobi bacterium]|nr:DUF4160 domain-containing protein [Chlorobiota bacterium]
MSPTVLRIKGYRFFFFSREEERMHIHVLSNEGEAKFWLFPEIRIVKSHKFSSKQVKEIEEIIKEHHDEFVNAWRKYFSS